LIETARHAVTRVVSPKYITSCQAVQAISDDRWISAYISERCDILKAVYAVTYCKVPPTEKKTFNFGAPWLQIAVKQHKYVNYSVSCYEKK